MPARSATPEGTTTTGGRRRRPPATLGLSALASAPAPARGPSPRKTAVGEGPTIAQSVQPAVPAPVAEDHRRRNVLVGVLFGCGIIAFVDEAVFHQLLHWHHFYDRSTSDAGLVSDGIFHAFSWFATVSSLFLFADLRRRRALQTGRWVAGILLGIGGFQLFDGLVQHKLLDLHEVRYGVDLLPYDLLWNGAAVLFMLAGLLVLLGLRRRAARPSRGD